MSSSSLLFKKKNNINNKRNIFDFNFDDFQYVKCSVNDINVNRRWNEKQRRSTRHPHQQHSQQQQQLQRKFHYYYYIIQAFFQVVVVVEEEDKHRHHPTTTTFVHQIRHVSWMFEKVIRFFNIFVTTTTTVTTTIQTSYPNIWDCSNDLCICMVWIYRR